MFIVTVFQGLEGDIPAYPDVHIDTSREQALTAMRARLDGAQERQPAGARPQRARLYQVDFDGPNRLISECEAAFTAAIETPGQPAPVR